MPKPIMVKQKCPKCGRHLIIREGQYGDFLGCPSFPTCRYTEPLPTRKEPEYYESPSRFCRKCNHTGLLPFIKQGKTVPNAWVDCECREKTVNHEYPEEVADFDFPCSDTFRGFYFQQYNQDGYDPGAVAIEKEASPLPEQVIIHRHSDMSRENYDLLQQTARRMSFLEGRMEKKLGELQTRRKPRGKY